MEKNNKQSWKFDKFLVDDADIDAHLSALQGYKDQMSSAEEVWAFGAGFWRGCCWMQCKTHPWHPASEIPEMFPSGVARKNLLVAFKVPESKYGGLVTISQPYLTSSGKLQWPYGRQTLDDYGYEAVAWMDIDFLAYQEDQDGQSA